MKDNTLNEIKYDLKEDAEKSIEEQQAKPKASQDTLDAKEEDLRKREEELKSREESVSAREVEVAKREKKVLDAERRQKDDLDKERLEREKALAEEISKERATALEEISNMMSLELEQRRDSAKDEAKGIVDRAKDEAARIREEAVAEAQEYRKRINAEADAEAAEKKSKVATELKALQEKEKKCDEKLASAEELEKDAERQRRRNEKREESIASRESDLDSLVEERWADRKKGYEAQIKEKDKLLGELRATASAEREKVAAMENFKASFGEEPVIIQKRMSDLQGKVDRLEDELAKRPSQAVETERDELKINNERLEKENAELLRENSEMRNSQNRVDVLEVENKGLNDKNGYLQNQVEELKAQVKRLSTAESRTADRNDRIKEIKSGYKGGFELTAERYEGDEVEWLDGIGRNCKDYGISFPQRILYAFHTALKISDWSTITVLAGVSGTGKSELPKLYAAFGGMNFISVPVQPSWDSQESMLGFFNSIDNRFEPEPLLKYLVQCTEDEDKKNNSPSKYMSIVLLDEMNLAHVEHYFAEFLSKLETRRGTNKNVPSVEVKLGAGIEPYELPLKRNVLWTGTMNQDETTKSLSDKVLDRGLVIYFPRPHTLNDRFQLPNLANRIKDRKMLTESKWNEWIIRTLDSVENNPQLLAELDGYKKIVEGINDTLEKVGKALGHRVWQSIMFYILNYPTVSETLRNGGSQNDKKWDFKGVEVSEELKKNMRTAFEDQIVQKIMPKLRGVETRGKSREHLQAIKDLLKDNKNEEFGKLKEDFDIACEQGYGQFIWSSAKYIEADDTKPNKQAAADDKSDSSEAQ